MMSRWDDGEERPMTKEEQKILETQLSQMIRDLKRYGSFMSFIADIGSFGEINFERNELN